MSTHSPTTEPQPVTAAPELAALEFFVGAWHATGKFHETPFGAEKPIAMTINAARRHGHHWLELRTAEIATAENQDPLTATYLWGFDAASRLYTAAWFDSRGGHATQTSPGWEGDRLTFTGSITAGEMTVPLRDTFIWLDDGHYRHIGETDLGDGWIPVDTEDALRVDRPVPARHRADGL